MEHGGWIDLGSEDFGTRLALYALLGMLPVFRVARSCTILVSCLISFASILDRNFIFIVRRFGRPCDLVSNNEVVKTICFSPLFARSHGVNI